MRQSGSKSARFRRRRSLLLSWRKSQNSCTQPLIYKNPQANAPRRPRPQRRRHEVRLGATAVHTIRQGGLVLKKGTPICPVEVAALQAAGIDEIVVARLEPGDVAEDVAAAEI